jgi:hypothetical protein
MKKWGVRQWILALALLAVIGLAAGSLVDTYLLKQELRAFAAEHETEYRATDTDKETGKTMYLVTTTVTAWREFGVFGPASGTVSLYTFNLNWNEKQAEEARELDSERWRAGHGNYVPYGGVKFHYVKENGAWVFTESGQLDSDWCVVEGPRAFRAADMPEYDSAVAKEP